MEFAAIETRAEGRLMTTEDIQKIKIEEELTDMDGSGCASSEPFALRVLGDSMEPEFKDGCVIIIDPDGVAENENYVIAEIDGEYIFRQYVEEANQAFLHAVNPGYPRQQLESKSAIRGVVTQRAGARRKYHKRYE